MTPAVKRTIIHALDLAREVVEETETNTGAQARNDALDAIAEAGRWALVQPITFEEEEPCLPS